MKHTRDRNEAITILGIINSLIEDNNICIDLINGIISIENERRQRIYDKNPSGVSMPKLVNKMPFITLEEIKVE